MSVLRPYPSSQLVLKKGAICAALFLVLVFPLGCGAADNTQDGNDGNDVKSSVTQCKDEAGLLSSQGAMRRINDQVQLCAAGNRWVLAPGFGATDGSPGSAQKACTGEHGETYDSGLYRAVDNAFERCEAGRWMTAGQE